MIQFLLILLGLISPNNNTKSSHPNQASTIVQHSTDLGENLDTGGETGPVLPPKK